MMKGRLADSFFTSENDGQPQPSTSTAAASGIAIDSPPPIFTTPVRRSKIPQPTAVAMLPKKGILKRPPAQNYSEQYIQPSMADIVYIDNESKKPSILERFMMIQALVDSPPSSGNAAAQSQQTAAGAHTMTVRPTVEFSERNAVAIIGDTSDDCTTEAHEPQTPLAANFPAAEVVSTNGTQMGGKGRMRPKNVVSPIRQPSIFFSEDSEESSEAAAAVHLRHHHHHQQQQSNASVGPIGPSAINNFRPSPLTYSSTSATGNALGPIEEDSGVGVTPSTVADERVSISPQARRAMFDSISTTEDDSHSITSSNGSANIVGKWWNGKSTRYVLHCDKRGCGDKHRATELSGADYLTPTQRKNKEIAVLSHQLKRCEAELEAKNKQLAQFRERLKEIEAMMESSQALSENVRLVQRQSEREEEFRAERAQLIERHETRVRQLIQETVEARTEMLKKTKQLERLKAELEVEKIERSCMTDETYAPTPAADVARKISALSAVSAERVVPIDGREGAAPNAAMAEMTAEQPAVVFDTGQQLQIALTQVEAYRNEALIWRTKAAQLEIVLKDFVAHVEEEQEAAEAEDEVKALAEEDGAAILPDPPMPLQQITKSMSATSFGSIANLHSLVKQATVKFTGRNTPRGASEVALGGTAGECRNAACADQRRKLVDEAAELRDKATNQAKLVEKLEDEKAELRSKYNRRKSELTALEALHGELSELAEARLAEATAAQDSLARIQTECANFKKAISYLESRCQVFQNVILDHGLIVRDDGATASALIASQLPGKGINATAAEPPEGCAPAELHHGFADPDYVVYYSKGAQTALTSASLDTANEKFFVLKRKLKIKEVEVEFSMERRRSAEQLADARESLHVKSVLVEQLTEQLRELAGREKYLSESHQHERDIYREKMEKLGQIAERVPILESEIELALKAKSQLELAFRRSERDFGDQMEAALADALNRRTEADAVWVQRVAFADETRRSAQAHLEKLQRDIEELRLRHSVEKAELEERLTSSICHVTELNNKLNHPKRDVECEAKPKTTNKYVACRPSQRVNVKETQIEAGELPDSPELVECRTELMKHVYQLRFADAKTRRLEEKLLDALATVQKKQSTISGGWLSVAPRAAATRRSMDCVTFRRNSDAVRISLRGASAAPALLPPDASEPEEEDEEISTVSSPAALVDALLECAVPPPPTALATSHRNETFTRLAQFAAQKSDEVKRLKIENDRLASEIHLLKERLFELENNAYEKSKDKVSHVSYLIPTKLEYDSCDNIELAVELTETAVRHRPVPPAAVAAQPCQSAARPCSLTAEMSGNGYRKRERAVSFDNLHGVSESQTFTTAGTIHRAKSIEKMLSQLAISKKLGPPRRVAAAPLAPSKWDFERNALIRRNAQLFEQLTRLKREVETALQRHNSLKGQVPAIIHTTDNGESNDADEPLMLLEMVCAELGELLNADNDDALPPANSARIRVECDALRRQLHDAQMELEIYRKEPRAIIAEAPKRCQSAIDLERSDSSPSTATRELARWKEMAGVMFRELNYLRAAASTSEAQRLELKTANAMLRGEIELAKCQSALVKELAERRLADGRRRRSSLGASGRKAVGPDDGKLRRKASLDDIANDIELPVIKTDLYVRSPSRHGSTLSSSIPNLSEFLELAERRAMEAQIEGDIARIGTQMQHVMRRRGSAAAGTVIVGAKPTKAEEALRKELGIIREAFHAQARRFRTTNLNLERRVGDLEARVRDQSAPETSKMKEPQNEERLQWLQAQAALVGELETRSAALESECAMLRAENEMYEKKVRDIEEEHQQMYMLMFRKGQQAAEAEIREDNNMDEMTEHRIMLKFLHDAFYYYLMNKGNAREHLQFRKIKFNKLKKRAIDCNLGHLDNA